MSRSIVTIALALTAIVAAVAAHRHDAWTTAPAERDQSGGTLASIDGEFVTAKEQGDRGAEEQLLDGESTLCPPVPQPPSSPAPALTWDKDDEPDRPVRELISSLKKAHDEQDRERVEALVAAFLAMKEKAVSDLAELARSDVACAEERILSIRMLGELRTQPANAALVCLMVEEPNPRLKKVAGLSLKQSGSEGVTPELLELLRTNESPTCTIYVANILSSIARESADSLLQQTLSCEAVPCLRDLLLSQKDKKYHRSALFALGELPGDGATSVLLEAFRDKSNMELHQTAALVLSKTADAAVIRSLQDMFRDTPSPSLKISAAVVLGRIARWHPNSQGRAFLKNEAAPVLHDLASCGSSGYIRAAAKSAASELADR